MTAAGSGLRGKGGASQVAERLSHGLEGRGKAGSGWRGEVGGGESLELRRIMWLEKGHRWAWGQKVNPRWEKEKRFVSGFNSAREKERKNDEWLA